MIIYEAATGRLLGGGPRMPQGDAPPLLAGLAMADVDCGAPNDFYWAGALVAKGARPSLDHQWDWPSHSWVAPLETVKAAKVRQAQARRDQHLYGGFAWSGSQFDSDQISQTRLMGLYVSAGSTPGIFPVAWRLADNAWRDLSVADAVGVWVALQSHIAIMFVAFAAHEATINDLPDLASVQQYDVAIGWPDQIMAAYSALD